MQTLIKSNLSLSLFFYLSLCLSFYLSLALYICVFNLFCDKPNGIWDMGRVGESVKAALSALAAIFFGS